MENYRLKIPINGEPTWVSASVVEIPLVTELVVTQENESIGTFFCYDDVPDEHIQWIESGKGATELAKIVGEEFDRSIRPLLQKKINTEEMEVKDDLEID